MRPRMRRRIVRAAGAAAAGLAVAYLLLLLPDPAPVPPASGADARPFAWRADASWDRLEAGFASARARGCEAVGADARAALGALAARVDALGHGVHGPDDPLVDDAG